MSFHIADITLVFILFLSSFYAHAVNRPVRPEKFSEAEIKLDENFTLSSAQSLPLAPGSEVQVLDDSRAVRVQLPQKSLEQLAGEGVDVTVIRNFILVSGDVNPNEAILDSAYAYGINSQDVGISDQWSYSYIDFQSWPAYPVTAVDVHYDVYGSGGFMYLELSDEDYGTFTYVLLDGEYSDGLLSDTVTGITDFAGKLLNQYWILWAAEYYGVGSGYIDSWWIKLYYDSPGGYCSASGGCDEYISRVQFDTIDNSSGCSGGYSDYISISNQMTPLDTEIITVTNGQPYTPDECGIWIDWNQDEDFDDAGESIAVTGSPGGGPYTALITPPAGAVLGDTRMRIRICYNETPLSCGSSTWGEVEDYTITVIEPLPQTRIYGKKWNDLNDNGQIDAGEPGLAGWTIFLDENYNGQIDPNDISDTTDSQGNYEFTDLDPDQYYHVSEEDQAGWINTYPGAGGINYRIWVEENNDVEVNFGNYQLHNCDITGHKFYDANNNGVWDAGEDPLSGWEIYIDENENGTWDSGEPKTTTDTSGYYEFTNLAPGYYNIMEVPQSGWFQTYPGITSGRLWALDAGTEENTTIAEVNLSTMTIENRFVAPFNSIIIGIGAMSAGPSTLFYCPMKLTSMETAESLFFEMDCQTGLVIDQGVLEMPDNEIPWNCAWLDGILYVVSVRIPIGDPRVVFLNRYDATTKQLISRDSLVESAAGDALMGDPYENLLLTNRGVPWAVYEIQPDTADVVRSIIQQMPLRTLAAYTRGVLYKSHFSTEEMTIIHRYDGSLLSTATIPDYTGFDTLAGGVGTKGGHRVWIGKHDIEANFGNRPDSEGVLSGTKYEDTNGNGERDANEPGLAGFQMYLDLDGDAQLDAGEPAAVTDANGNWAIGELESGNYFVREVQQKGYIRTEPDLEWVQHIHVNQTRDIIFDNKRNLLYVTTQVGNVERYDLAANKFLSPVVLSGSPYAMDITEDCNALYVTDIELSGGDGVVHKINLETLAVTDLTYTTDIADDGGYDIAIGSEGIALLTSSNSSTTLVHVYVLDTAADTITVRPDILGQSTVYNNARLIRSHDRTRIWLINNRFNGRVIVYDAPSDTFISQNYFNDYLNQSPVALNYDGSLAAVQLDNHCRIVDANFNMIMGLDDSKMAGAFDPAGDIYYQFSHEYERLLALDTVTWQVADEVGPGIINGIYEKFVRGETTVKSDGRVLAVTAPNDVVLFRKEYYVPVLPGREISGLDFGNKPLLCGDIDRDRDVDLFDLSYLCENWLYRRLMLDIAPDVRDNVVSLPDLARFAAAWQSEKGDSNWDALCDVAPVGGDNFVGFYDLAVLADEWLMQSSINENGYDADIAGLDNYVDMTDFACLAGNWRVDEGLIEYDEDFETGDFTNLPWVHGGDAPWVISSSGMFEGAYCAKSPNLYSNDESILSIEISCRQGYIYFMIKIADDCRFYFNIDDELAFSTYYETLDYSLIAVPVSAGTHTFKWRCCSGPGAWIDAIRFPQVDD